MSEFQSLSLAETERMLAQLQAQRDALANQQKADLASAGADYFNTIIATHEMAKTESTGRVGISVLSMPFTGEDGREYSISIHVTDVAETEKGKAQVAARKEAEKAKEALRKQTEKNPALAEALAKLGV